MNNDSHDGNASERHQEHLRTLERVEVTFKKDLYKAKRKITRTIKRAKMKIGKAAERHERAILKATRRRERTILTLNRARSIQRLQEALLDDHGQDFELLFLEQENIFCQEDYDELMNL
jgi:hypothetical protein